MRRLARDNRLEFNDLLIWKGRMGAFKPALDAHWKPYLDGKGTLEDALLGLLES